jgi:long-chain acyl-CoA synthetase
MAQGLISALEESIKKNWTLPALSDFKGETLSYGDVAKHVALIHGLFKAAGVKPGDKVSLCLKNSASWGATFLGALTYGVVVVPLLHEFHPATVEHLVNHSEAKILFTEKLIFDKLDAQKLSGVEAVVLLPDFTLALCHNDTLKAVFENRDRLFAEAYPNGYSASDVHFEERDETAMALINYTSGSTGNSKGVMLSYLNLWSNIRFGLANIPFLKPGDGMLSMLPLAHMYGLVFEFLFPFCRGCHITFLGRVPSPAVVLQAFAHVKPQLVITVPLVIEKIVKGKVFPKLKTGSMKLLLALPGIRNIIYSKVKEQLLSAFGGEVKQLILGGAAMSSDVEDFLRCIKFPFTVGYGMTECAPLVTYAWWADQRPHSCGRLCDGMAARVDSPDPQHEAGVLHVKGDNVMQGYFKNPEATAEALDADGWLNTGDICTIDADGYVYLRGRDKNMILTSSGQNVYPEEIEVILNNLPLVGESVVVDRDGKIVAIVHPDYEAGKTQGLDAAAVEARVEANLPALNTQLPAYSKVSKIEILKEEFEKTPKHSIRRFLYK